MTIPGIIKKVETIKEGLDSVAHDVIELEKTVKEEYTPMYKHNEIEKQVSKFEEYWNWFIKLIFGALTLAVIGLLLAKK